MQQTRETKGGLIKKDVSATLSRNCYKTGSKADVLRSMACFAIRDQESLIDAWTPVIGKPDQSAIEHIQSAKANIEDYRKFLKTLFD